MSFPGAWRAVPGDHLHSDSRGDARDLAPNAAEADNAERLAEQLHALGRLPRAGAHLAIHPRNLARTGEQQRDRVLRHRRVAVALDRVHRDPELAQSGDVHIARRAGAQEHDMFEIAALRDRDRVAGKQARQVGARKRRLVHGDGRVIGAMHPHENRFELLVAIDEQRSHSVVAVFERFRVSPFLGDSITLGPRLYRRR